MKTNGVFLLPRDWEIKPFRSRWAAEFHLGISVDGTETFREDCKEVRVGIELGVWTFGLKFTKEKDLATRMIEELKR